MREVEDQGRLWPVSLSSKKYPLSREQVPFQNPEESELQVENVNMAKKPINIVSTIITSQTQIDTPYSRQV